MSSYYPSFSYLGVNSRDKGLIVSHFDADQGEMDTFLGMEPIYTESADGSRRLDYGAKYNNVAVFRITTIKEDGGDFSVKEVRDNLRWLTGAKSNSSLDLFENFVEDFVGDGSTVSFELVNTCDHIARIYVGGVVLDKSQWTYERANNSINLVNAPNSGMAIRVAYGRIKYSFVCRVTNAWQYKMDARTTGLVLEFTSVSPWAYSAPQVLSFSGEQMGAEEDDIHFLNNESDDLYGYTPINVQFMNTTGTSLTLRIWNEDFQDLQVTEVTGLVANEVITISDNMIITSDVPGKVLGSSFNFVFPRLLPGKNYLRIVASGEITLTYVYAMKVGDCAMDLSVISDPICSDTGEIILDTLPFSRISDLPNNFQAYNIQNVYSKVEVDALVAGIEIDENELNAMLVEELN